MERVSVALVVDRHEVHHQQVSGCGVHAADPDLEGREHPPAKASARAAR